MRAFFPSKTTSVVVDDIRKAIHGRKLGEITTLEEKAGNIVVTISKLGTTVLTFATKARDGGVEIALSNEKIALAHKALKGEVTDKLAKVVEQVGGNILSR